MVKNLHGKRAHIYYSGRVQGVGFRFTVEDIANGLGVKGCVKNLRDGRVEVIAEGEESQLNNFLEQIKQYFSDCIRDVDLTWQESSGEFADFGIRF